MVGWGSSGATTLFSKLNDDVLEEKYKAPQAVTRKARRYQAEKPVEEAAVATPQTRMEFRAVAKGSVDWDRAVQQVEHFAHSNDERYVIVPDVVERVVEVRVSGDVSSPAPALPTTRVQDDPFMARVRTPNHPVPRDRLASTHPLRPSTQQGRKPAGGKLLGGRTRSSIVPRERWGENATAQDKTSTSTSLASSGDDEDATETVFKIVGGTADDCMRWCREGLPMVDGPCGRGVYLPFVNRGNLDTPLDTAEYTRGGLALLVCAVDVHGCEYLREYAHPAALGGAGCVSCVVAPANHLVAPRYLVRCKRVVAAGLRRAVLPLDALSTNGNPSAGAPSCSTPDAPAFLNCPVHPSCPLDVVCLTRNELLCAVCVASGLDGEPTPSSHEVLPAAAAVASFQSKAGCMRETAASLASHFQARVAKLRDAKAQCETRTEYLLGTIERKQVVLVESINVCAREAKQKVRDLQERALRRIDHELARGAAHLASLNTLQADAVRLTKSLATQCLTAPVGDTAASTDPTREHVLMACTQQSRFTTALEALRGVLDATLKSMKDISGGGAASLLTDAAIPSPAVACIPDAGTVALANIDGDAFRHALGEAVTGLTALYPVADVDAAVAPLAGSEVVSTNADLKLCELNASLHVSGEPPPARHASAAVGEGARARAGGPAASGRAQGRAAASRRVSHLLQRLPRGVS